MRVTCKQCGKSFELSQSEIDFYKKKNLSLPKRCKECREHNKAEKAGKTQKVEQSGSSKPVICLVLAILVVACILGGYVVQALNSFQGENTLQQQLPTVAESQEAVSLAAETQPETDANFMVEEQTVTEMQSDMQPETQAQTQPETQAQTQPEPQPSATESVSEVAQVTEPQPAASSVSSPVSQPESSVQEIAAQETTYKFRSKKLLNQHYEKHGIEMGFASAADYQEAASAVINDPNALYKTEKEDGDGVYYIEETNEFVILSVDGYIRTYFNPSGGIDYFNRQ